MPISTVSAWPGWYSEGSAGVKPWERTTAAAASSPAVLCSDRVNSGSGADRVVVVPPLGCGGAGAGAPLSRVVVLGGCAVLVCACVGGPLTDTVFVDEPHAFRLASEPPSKSAAVTA